MTYPGLSGISKLAKNNEKYDDDMYKHWTTQPPREEWVDNMYKHLTMSTYALWLES